MVVACIENPASGNTLIITTEEEGSDAACKFSAPLRLPGAFSSVALLEAAPQLLIFLQGTASCLQEQQNHLTISIGNDRNVYLVRYDVSGREVSAVQRLNIRDDLDKNSVCCGALFPIWDFSACTASGMPSVVLIAQITHDSLIDAYVPGACKALYASRTEDLQVWSPWTQLSPASTEGTPSLVPELASIFYVMQTAAFSSHCCGLFD